MFKCGCPPSIARRQLFRKRHFGIAKDKKQREIAASFHIAGYNMALFYMNERRMISAHDGGLDSANALF